MVVPLRRSPPSWGFAMEVYSRTVRFIMAGGDWKIVRGLTEIYDWVERFWIWAMGFHVEPIRRKIHGQSVSGTWILSDKDCLPDAGADEWQDRTVVFWAHGGGFGAGSALTFASAHCEVINLHSRLQSSLPDNIKKPLLYFSLEYPLAPGRFLTI
jgi:hypothetical protein